MRRPVVFCLLGLLPCCVASSVATISAQEIPAEAVPSELTAPAIAVDALPLKDQAMCADCGMVGPRVCGCVSARGWGGWWQRLKARKQDCYWGYADAFCEPPFGASLNAHLQTQIVNGQSAAATLYQYDFSGGGYGNTLNPHGRRRLAQMVANLDYGRIRWITIERNAYKPQLDAARRAHVLTIVRQALPNADDNTVFLGDPVVEGIPGEEAEMMQQNLIRGVQAAGSPLLPSSNSRSSGTSFSGASTR